MTPQIPDYLLDLEAPFQVAQVAIGLGLVGMGAARMTASAPARYATAAALSMAFLAWQATAQYLGGADTYLAAAASPAALPLALLVPLAIGALALWRSGRISGLVSAIPLPWLVLAQTYRLGGAIFLVLWADGRLPWQFALPAGIGDVATGLGALIVSSMLAKRAAGAYRSAWVWSLFGIADLVVAVAMGTMTSPGPVHLLALDAPNLLITAYPLVMVPTFAVPLALMLHGLVLRRLLGLGTASGRLAAA